MSVDKNTVLIAEQVGLFLIPMLRDLAKAQSADAFAAVQAGLVELRTAAEQHRATLAGDIAALRAEFDGVLRNIEKTLEGLATEASVSELRLDTSAVTTELRASTEARFEKLETGLLSTDAGLKAIKSTCEALDNGNRNSLAAIIDLSNDLAGVRDLTLSNAEKAHSELEEVAGHLRGMVSTLGKTVCTLEAAEPKTVTIKAEPDAEAITAEVGRAVAAAVQAIKLPESIVPDLAPLLEGCRTAVAHEIATVTPALRESLAANVREEVSSAVSRIKLPELDLREVASECQSAAAAAVAVALPQLRESLALNVRDEVSRTVAALPKPKDGEPGPAGLMAAVEPYIEGCVYERLALVSHAGGAWQATRRTKTAPSANLGDWQAIAVGVARVSAQASDDLRTVEVVAALTDGTEAKHTVEVPAMVYRDVYDDAEEYGQMDVVTYAGSMWLALKGTKGEAPSKSPEAWRLIVKRGQDGRAGKDGEHGVQFQAGFAGEYEEQRAYPPNAIVTYNGSTWLSKRPTKERPPYLTNADNDHWLRLR